MNQQDWIPNHQFGFRQAHSTIQQWHRVADTVSKALDNRQFCTAVILDVSQAFVKSGSQDYFSKLKILRIKYYSLLKSYLQGRHFVTKYNNETSRSFQIYSGVPQGSILGPLLYIIYTSDLPTNRDTTLGTFADDTAIFATHADPTTASRNLQEHLHTVENWLKNGK